VKKSTIAFIGAGNMGRSLISGLISDGYDPKKIWASNPSVEKLNNLKQQFGIQITQENVEAAKQADILVFCVKPQILPTVLKEVSETVKEQKVLVISIAAGVREIAIQNSLGGEIPIVRCMPNTPAMLGSGATGLYANRFVSDAQRSLAESIMRAVGITVWLEQEADLDIVTALSGSGPAYLFLVMEAMQEAGEKMGLSKDKAHLLTIQTVLGAAQMAMQSEFDVSTLREQVTSPGGTTESALKILEEGNIRELFSKALQAAQKRSTELADLIQ